MFGSWVMKGIQIETEIVATAFTVGGFMVAAAIIISVITSIFEERTHD